MGLSLWLSPREGSASFRSLQDVIDSTSSSPELRFEPHVTLLTNLPPVETLPLPVLIESVSAGVASWQSARPHAEASSTLELPFRRLTTGGSFFQCVLLELVKTPDLQRLHDAVREQLRPPKGPPSKGEMGKVLEGPDYYPHLSLLYADISQAEKERVVADILESGKAKKTGDGEGVEVAGVTNLEVDEILIVRTEGPPKEWKTVGRNGLFQS